MNQPIYVVGGSKGGVGKSLVTMALLHQLSQDGDQLFLIDADTSNPDVFKSYHGELASELVNLDEADGWIRFVNICDEHKESTVVVNTAARNNRGVAAYGGTLNHSLEELNRQLVTLWVINRQRDSLELLQDYMAALPHSAVHVAGGSTRREFAQRNVVQYDAELPIEFLRRCLRVQHSDLVVRRLGALRYDARAAVTFQQNLEFLF
jgi:hypothetical protein